MNNYRPWETKDINKLKLLIENKTEIEDMAKKLDRSKISIMNQIDMLSKGRTKNLNPEKLKDISDKYIIPHRGSTTKEEINFFDKRSQTPDYKEVWNSILDFQRVLEERSREQAEASIKINTSKWIGIAFMGDLHIGNVGTDYKTMLEHRDIISKTKNLYVALNGDYCDNYLPTSHASGMFEALFPPAVQKNLAKDFIERIKNKVLALVSGCFMKGSKVRMADGTEKNVEDIKKGDSVLTSDGKCEFVSKTFVNIHKGEVLKVYTAGNYEPLHVTWDHPCYVLRREKIFDRNKWKYTDKEFTKDNLELVRANELKPGDYMCRPIPATPKKYYNSIDKKIIKDFSKYRSYSFAIDKDFMKLAGYWLAEGHYGKSKGNINTLGLTLGITEENILSDILDTVNSLGIDNISVSRRPLKNTIDILIKNKELAIMFFELFGEYSHSKFIHPFILAQQSSLVVNLLYTFGLGDGHCRLKNANLWDMTMTTISRDLAQGLSYILDKCSIYHSVRQQKRVLRKYDDYQINVGQESINNLAELLSNDNTLPAKDLCHSCAPQIVRDGMIWQVIQNIESGEFAGATYNLTVENTHSLVVNGKFVHNCHDSFGLKASDWDLTEYLAKHGDAVYLGNGGVLWLTIGKVKYKVMMRHKYRFNSTDNPTATVKKMFEKMGGFDVGIISHSHISAIEDSNKEGLDGNLKRLFIRAGTYKVYDRYGKAGGFGKSALTVPVVLFSPSTRDIRGFQNITEGVEYLNYLNNKK